MDDPFASNDFDPLDIIDLIIDLISGILACVFAETNLEETKKNFWEI